MTQQTRITYQSDRFTVYALSDDQLLRLDEISRMAESAYLCGEEVIQVCVSDLQLTEESFKVRRCDFEEIKIMTQGHMQLADPCRLGFN